VSVNIKRPATGSFGKYSKYYDLLYQDKNYPGEVAFITELLDRYAPSGSSLLELGCGTGLHAAMLAEGRWAIDGLDLSDDMLLAAEGRKKMLPAYVANRLRFFQGDVRKFETGKQYDAVVSLFHVVSYQTSNPDTLEMFRRVAEHLKPGGVFIFDYWYGPAVLTDRPAVRVKRMHSSELDITRLAEPVIYPNTSIVDVNYEIQVHEKKSGNVEILHETHHMRYFFLTEIDLLLREAGLRMLTSSEWLTGKEPGWNTWGVCSVAVK
jgi:SAM-dependent methyltransferase